MRETMEKEKEALEKRIEDLEAAKENNNNEMYKPVDMFRVRKFTFFLGALIHFFCRIKVRYLKNG